MNDKIAAYLICLIMFLGSIVFIVEFTPLVEGTATLYVGGTGPGNYSKIQDAIDAATNADAVFVYKGTYNENLVIGKRINLIGEDRDNTLIDGGGAHTVIEVDVTKIEISGFSVFNGTRGINLNHEDKNVIENNKLYSLSGSGIHLFGSTNNEIVNNLIFNCNNGILLYMNSIDNIISSNNISSIDSKGIYLSAHCNSNIIAENNISSCNNDGIGLYLSSDNKINENHISFNYPNGIEIYHESANNNIISNNTIMGSGQGIYIEYSEENHIEKNDIINNNYGVYLHNSNNNTFDDNNLTDNGFYIFSYELEDWNTHNIDSSNTVNGKPIYYLANRNGMTVPEGAGQVILANCTNITVRNQNLTNASVGILSAISSNNNFINNDVSNNTFGIFLWRSRDNHIENNNCSNCEYGLQYGWSSRRDTLINNYITDNEYGIWFEDSGQVNITGNIIKGNHYGIKFDWSGYFNIINNIFSNNIYGLILNGNVDYNNIIENVFSDNEYGICLYTVVWEDEYWPENNKIYHNNFINNTLQVIEEFGPWNPERRVKWDKGYPSGGNYWSDYNGSDEFSGPGQNLSGSDGIGDIPYKTNPDNQDNYPFMELLDLFPPVIEGITIYPLPQDIENNVNISALVTDNVQIYGVWIEIYRPNGTPLGNYSMEHNIDNNRYYFVDSYSFYGNYPFKIWANDTSGRSAYTLGEFKIKDITPPIINPAFVSPSFQEAWESVNISVNITDNYNVSEVWLEITYPNWIESTNFHMNYDDTFSTYYLNQSYSLVGLYEFTIWAFDFYNNSNSYSGSFNIISLPGAPIIISANSYGNAIHLNWSDPQSDGGIPITNYRIYRGTSRGTQTFLIEIGNITFYNDTTVNPRITYYYKISAVNALGEGVLSYEVSVPATDPSSSTPDREISWGWLIIWMIAILLIIIGWAVNYVRK
jgi:parallel beta-helix repeat protein